MPADEIEVHEGAEEGIHLHNQRGPREVLIEDGKLTGLRTVRCTAVFDASGRFNPSFDEAQVEDIPADSIIFAIGQTSDLSFLDPADGVESERGLIKVNRETYQTTAPDIFACGDIAHGARLFIDAIASAQIAARSMHDFLRGTRTEIAVRKQWSPATYTMAESWNTLRRENPPALESEKRAASLEIVEVDYAEDDARRQASRCLRCNVNTVFDTEKCVACNGCVDVCPENLIRLVPRQRDLRRGNRRDRRRHDQGRDHLHPLRHVRLALPHPRHPDEALRFLTAPASPSRRAIPRCGMRDSNRSQRSRPTPIRAVDR